MVWTGRQPGEQKASSPGIRWRRGVKKVAVMSGNRTLVFRVTGGDTNHYTNTTAVCESRRIGRASVMPHRDFEGYLLQSRNV